mmetsp:Transcript_17819/g.42829  ORF Transcript_17819/g.42829 Transcript_17819/m.42829 type:complete len:97 (-) Transcript_17819:690-980(-)
MVVTESSCSQNAQISDKMVTSPRQKTKVVSYKGCLIDDSSLFEASTPIKTVGLRFLPPRPKALHSVGHETRRKTYTFSGMAEASGCCLDPRAQSIL